MMQEAKFDPSDRIENFMENPYLLMKKEAEVSRVELGWERWRGKEQSRRDRKEQSKEDADGDAGDRES